MIANGPLQKLGTRYWTPQNPARLYFAEGNLTLQYVIYYQAQKEQAFLETQVLYLVSGDNASYETRQSNLP